jgi:hypothetical protein
MVGGFLDFDWLNTQTEADESGTFSLSTDQHKAGNKSLKYPFVLQKFIIGRHKTLSQPSGGRSKMWFFMTSPTGSNRSGLFCGGNGFSGDNDYEHGMAGVFWNDLGYLRIAHFDGNGVLIQVVSGTDIGNLTINQWYLIEMEWTKITNTIYITLTIYDTDGSTILQQITGNYTDAAFGDELGILINTSNNDWYFDEFYVYD